MSDGYAIFPETRLGEASMDLPAVAKLVDFNNPVSWVALCGFLLGVTNTALALMKLASDRSRLRVIAMVQGPQRAPEDDTAMPGDEVTLTLLNTGTKPVPVSHVGAERVEEDGFRHEFALHLHPRAEARLQPGEMRTVRVMDARALDRRVRWLGVTDTLGRTYKVRRRELRNLIRKEERARRSALVEQCRRAPQDAAH